MNPPDSPYWLCQDLEEFVGLLSYMKGSKSALEIGSRYGESLRWIANNCADRSRIVSVDLGVCVDTGQDCKPWWYDVGDHLAKRQFDVHLVQGDSHNPEVVEKVRGLGPYDFIFIDGDHSYDGVKADWENYGPMGKIVAFHDIIGVPDVKRFWNEIKVGKEGREIMKSFGIGILYQ